MTYLRGDKAEFDAWEELGNPGWNWNSLFAKYKEIEKFFPPKTWQEEIGASYEPSVHGYDGNLHVGFPPTLEKGLYGNFSKAWKALGYEKVQDPNDGSVAGFSVWPMTLDPEQNHRSDAATSFYWPIQPLRENLSLIKGTATKIVWGKAGCASKRPGRVAQGVQYLDTNGALSQITARKEVILSAGALRTPLILERSGVGNPKILGPLGIETVIDAPTVGENLIDQPNLAIIYGSNYNTTGTTPYATFASMEDLFGKTNADALASSTKERLGAWAKDIETQTNGALKASALEKQFAIQHKVIFQDKVTIAEILTAGLGSALVTVSWALLPFSRGSVHLKSASDTDIDKPVINPRLLSNDFDMQVQIASCKLSRKLWQTAPADTLVTAPVVPSLDQVPLNASDSQWEAFIRATYQSNSHSLGTAAMMARDLGGVVDPELRVYGAANVRVVDASVLPTQFSGHLTATLYAVADRAANMIQLNDGLAA